MKYIVLVMGLLFLCGTVISAAELSAEEWDKKKQEFDTFIADHAAAVEAGEAQPIKCLTPMILDLFLSNPSKFAASPLARRDDLPETYGTEHFLLHYITTGRDSVYQPSQQDSAVGVPNYIFIAGIIAEEVYAKYEVMGYDLPPTDGAQSENGGDGRFDLYFAQLGSAYGVTYADEFVGSQAVTSYIILENDYREIHFNNTYDNLRVTIAHEFFHAIQFGYDIFEYDPVPGGSQNTAWVEMSAVFMEEEHYDNINDYTNFIISYFYNRPQWSLRFGTNVGTDRTWHMYGSVVWPRFLHENFPSVIDSGIVHEIWDSCRAVPNSNWWPATDTAIRRRSGNTDSLESMFTEFTLWNLFTDSRARPGEYFEEAAIFGEEVAVAATVNSYPTIIQLTDTLLPDNFGVNYIFLNNTTAIPEGLSVNFSPAGGYEWALQVVGLPLDVTNGTVWVDPIIYTQDDQIIAIPNASSFNQVVLIPTVLSSLDSTISYTMVISPLGEGVVSPAGGEMWYAGETHRVSWVLDDSTLAIDIEYSTDSGLTWTNIARVPNLSYNYDWVVPATPSIECFVRIVDAENSDIADTSGMFSILVTEGTQVKDPYPNPAWVHMTDGVNFKGIVEASAADPRMSIIILNLAGEKINDILPDATGTGELVIQWDFKNNQGETVAAGAYLAVIELNGETTVKKFMVLR